MSKFLLMLFFFIGVNCLTIAKENDSCNTVKAYSYSLLPALLENNIISVPIFWGSETSWAIEGKYVGKAIILASELFDIVTMTEKLSRNQFSDKINSILIKFYFNITSYPYLIVNNEQFKLLKTKVIPQTNLNQCDSNFFSEMLTDINNTIEKNELYIITTDTMMYYSDGLHSCQAMCIYDYLLNNGYTISYDHSIGYFTIRKI